MTKSRWKSIESVFNLALEIPVQERESFVKNSCAGDPDLQQEVLKLLEEDNITNAFLDDSIVEVGYNLLSRNENGITVLEGQRIGNYEILSFLGNGGMGAVYTARDKKLKRLVALKILIPTYSDEDHITSFKNEARAASAVTHPNIAHIYEYNFIDGKYFIAMEYIEGKTLRQKLINGDLDTEQIINIGLQICHALSSAHSLGIIHRDIKPENIMVREDYVVKILDFGLAGIVDETLKENMNNLGVRQNLLRGTTSYMSPEQIHGGKVDQRTDIWSFGIMLYEMFEGARPFDGPTTHELFNSILTGKIRDFDKLKQKKDSNLIKLIRHALNKNPNQRFQSAQDLAFSLESLQQPFERKILYQKRQRPKGVVFPLNYILFAAMLIISAISLFTIDSLHKSNVSLQKNNGLPAFQQQTFQSGTIWNARFSPDGNTINYSASWNESKLEIFSTLNGLPESRSFKLPNTNLLAVSSKGELALLKPEQYIYQFIQQGTLSRMPANGEVPREITDHVQEADWSPDGENLAISRYSPTGNQLEYPIGKVLFETRGYISNLRVSPKNDFVAFLEHPKQRDNRGYVSIVDQSGNKRTLTSEFTGLEGLAWNPVTGEIWFTASKDGDAYSLYATTLAGVIRLVSRVPSNLTLYDISNTGRVLLSRSTQFTDIFGVGNNGEKEQNLSWLYIIGISDLNIEGSEFVLTHFGDGSGINYSVYLRKTDGSQPIRLGDGRALALSPDSKFVLAKLNVPEQLNIVPTKAGEPRKLSKGNIEMYDKASWFPDGKNILFTGNEPGMGKRTFIQNLDDESIKPLTSVGVTGTLISPDGSLIVVKNLLDEKLLFNIAANTTDLIKGLEINDEVINWADDNRSLYIFRPSEMPMKVYKLDIGTGQKTFIKAIHPANKVGIFGNPYLFMTPDAKYYLYGLRRYLFDLYTVDNLS